MNPIFPTTAYTPTAIGTTSDPTIRQYLRYDSWLYNERVRNWTAYKSYVQFKKAQEDLRIRVLQQQYESNMARFYEHQRLVLDAQQQQQQQEQQQQKEDEAAMDSYLKEIDEQRKLQELEVFQDEQVQAPEDDPEEWNKAAEDFAKSCRAEELQERRHARRERQRESRRENRALARADKALGKLIQNHNEPVEAEISRAENYNADKPSRSVRYVGADKRKGQRFQARRQFGSGWAKQQL
jgi:hypothetical protein